MNTAVENSRATAFLKMLTKHRSVRKSGQRHARIPWPIHTNSIVQKAGWGGALIDDKDRYKTSQLSLKNRDRITVTPLRRYVFISALLALIGLSLLALPFITGLFVYEIETAEVSAFKQVVHELKVIYMPVGGLMLLAALSVMCRKFRIAEFDFTTGLINASESRFFGLYRCRQSHAGAKDISMSSIAGFQIIYYHGKTRSEDNQVNHLKYQYELNVVLQDSQRINILKQNKKGGMQRDALAIASRLGVPVWDRSEPFEPDNLALDHKLLQPL